MARHFSARQLTIVTLGICMAATWSVQNARGTDYDWVTQSSSPGLWHSSSNWTPTGIPNSSSDTATIATPAISPSGPFTLVVDSPATVAALTIDNSAYTDSYNLTLDGDTLTFQSAAGSASYTETAGGVGNDQTIVYNAISVLSDTVMTFDHRDDKNSSSLFKGVITGTSDRTITKEGLANLQLEDHGGAGFEGQYIINNGGLRFTGNTNMSSSTGITVNAGGQLQINSNDTVPTYDWNLANGAMLTLNGSGKSGGSAPGGALRFQGQGGQADHTVTFHNEVVLQSDTVITGGPAQVTGELDNVVSGSGGLLKTNGPATIVISNPASGWDGDTTVDSGVLSLSNPILSDSADVYLVGAGILDLNYTGTDDIDSLFIDGESQAVGLWGADGNGLAEHTTTLITGDGLLNVQTSAGLPGDYNGDNVVDAADYALWRSDPSSYGGDPDGYNTWVDHFGETAGSGSGSLAASAAVPEPGTGLLALFAVGAWLALAVKR